MTGVNEQPGAERLRERARIGGKTALDAHKANSSCAWFWVWAVLQYCPLPCGAKQHPRGYSSVGRALRSHRRGRGFDYH